VKIREIQKTTLEEGFLDNLIAKASNIAGGDGITGFVRGLLGQEAGLNRVTDAIRNQVEGAMRRRLGNDINNIQDGSKPTPIAEVLKQALAVGVKLANDDGQQIDQAQINGIIRTRQQQLMTLIKSGDIRSDAVVIQNIYNALSSGTDPQIKNTFSESVRTVCMFVAGAILLAGFEDADKTNAEFTLDRADKEKFDQVGEKINTTLFSPTSPTLRALNPDEDFKDNIENLIARMSNQVKEYSSMPAVKLGTYVSNPPKIVTAGQLQGAFAGHNGNADPEQINALAEQMSNEFSALLTAYLEAAIKEAQVKDNAAQSFEQIWKPWAVNAFNALDNLKFKQQQPAQQQQTNNASVELKHLEDSHAAGEKAVRDALEKNKDLKPEQIKNIYDYAREDWDRSHPVT